MMISAYNPYKTAVFFLLLLIATLQPLGSSCTAYFSADTDLPSIKTITPRIGALPPSFSNYLVWTDNNAMIKHFPLKKDNSQQTIGQHLGLFYMPLIEIMIQQKMMHAPSEYSLENILYANLKMRRLLDEYDNLKNRSKMILEGLDIPYINRQSNFENSNITPDFSISYQLERLHSQIEILAGQSYRIYEAIDRFQSPGFQTNQQSKTAQQRFASKQALNQPYRMLIGKPKRHTIGDVPPPVTGNGRTDIEKFGKDEYDPQQSRSMFDLLIEYKLELVIFLFIFFGLYRILFFFWRRKI